MATNAVNRVIQHLRRTALRQDRAGLPDSELLEQYVTRQDEAAFEALVRRHGPMVLGVCRRVLRNEADAEDAFQATFLVLVRRAASIRSRSTVSNWLYGVAHNTALKAKAMNSKRRTKERQAGMMPKPEAAEEVWGEVQALLDTELSRLPDKYRIPIVLCDLEGKTIKEAARHLGWPQGTAATRLARGRALLAKRLAKHGLTLSGGVLTAALSHGTATASVPPALVISTIKAASLFASGQAAAGVISAKVAALTERVVKAMFVSYLRKTMAVSFIAAVLCAAGSGLLYRSRVGGQTPEPSAKSTVEPKPEPTWRVRTTLRGHTGAVSGVAISSDNKLLASASFDKTVKLWETATGRLKTSLKGHSDRVFSVAFAPDGKTLASASADGTAKLWDVDKGEERATLQGHSRWVWSVAFSPDGKILASASGNTGTLPGERKPAEVKLWDVANGQERATIQAHTGYIYCVLFSPDGKTLATSSNDLTIKLWDIDDNLAVKERATLQGHTDVPGALAFSPDGKVLASAGTSDESVRLWNTATGDPLATFKHPNMNVGFVAFSPDGKTLATGGDLQEKKRDFTELGGVIKLWNVASRKEQVSLREDVRGACVAFSPDGRLLATGHAGSGKGKVAKGETRIEGDRNGIVKLWEFGK